MVSLTAVLTTSVYETALTLSLWSLGDSLNASVTRASVMLTWLILICRWPIEIVMLRWIVGMFQCVIVICRWPIEFVIICRWPTEFVRICRWSIEFVMFRWLINDVSVTRRTAYCIGRVVSISYLNQWSKSLGFFCHVPLNSGQWDWDWRLRLNNTRNIISCNM